MSETRLTILETNYKHMTDELKELKEVVKDGFCDLKKQLEHHSKESDSKYASKLTEKIVYGLIGIVLTAIFIAVTRLVII
jgi:hypothetical protein